MPYGISHYKSLYRDSNDTIYLEEAEGQVFFRKSLWSLWVFTIYFSLKFNAGRDFDCTLVSLQMEGNPGERANLEHRFYNFMVGKRALPSFNLMTKKNHSRNQVNNLKILSLMNYVYKNLEPVLALISLYLWLIIATAIRDQT